VKAGAERGEVAHGPLVQEPKRIATRKDRPIFPNITSFGCRKTLEQQCAASFVEIAERSACLSVIDWRKKGIGFPCCCPEAVAGQFRSPRHPSGNQVPGRYRRAGIRHLPPEFVVTDKAACHGNPLARRMSEGA